MIKPDQGSGASNTVKVCGGEGLDAFEEAKIQDVSYVAEEFINGIVLTYDSLLNRDGEV